LSYDEEDGMSAGEIVEVVGELVVDDGKTLEEEHGARALTVAREMETALVPRLEEDPAYAPLWQQFRATPKQQGPVLEGILRVVLDADAALARRLDDLLEAYRQAQGAPRQHVNTGGGAFVGGSVSVQGGDFVGRDKTTVTGDGNVMADHGSTAVLNQGVEAGEVAALFDRALALARQEPPAVRENLEAAVEMVQEETAAGEEADKRLLNKALDVLLEEGPDVLELVLEAVLNPAAAAGKGARMLAKQARKSLERKRKRSG
jgi:hypothetical protein